MNGALYGLPPRPAARRTCRKTNMVREGLDALFVGLRLVLAGDFAGAQRSLYFLAWTPSDRSRR